MFLGLCHACCGARGTERSRAENCLVELRLDFGGGGFGPAARAHTCAADRGDAASDRSCYSHHAFEECAPAAAIHSPSFRLAVVPSRRLCASRAGDGKIDDPSHAAACYTPPRTHTGPPRRRKIIWQFLSID